MKLTYPACFYPCETKDEGYTVEIPDLPGCVSEGDSLADAINMATDAASGWILDELEDGNEENVARFSYEDVFYTINATMKEADFKELLNNLYFF